MGGGGIIGLVIRRGGDDRVRNYFDVEVLGYTTTREGAPLVRSLAAKSLPRRTPASLREWDESPYRKHVVAVSYWEIGISKCKAANSR